MSYGCHNRATANQPIDSERINQNHLKDTQMKRKYRGPTANIKSMGVNQQKIAVLCNYELLPERVGGMDYFYWMFDAKCKEQGIEIVSVQGYQVGCYPLHNKHKLQDHL